MSRIEEQVFDEPSGTVRGVVIAFAQIKGKEKRIAHASLLTKGGSDVALEVPRKVSVADIAELTAVLNSFAKRVAALSV